MEYALKRKVSLSTLRRHIKSNKLVYKIENGRYLIWDGDSNPMNAADRSPALHSQALQRELSPEMNQLALALKKAQKEIVELKTLIALYEEKIPPHQLSS